MIMELEHCKYEERFKTINDRIQSVEKKLIELESRIESHDREFKGLHNTVGGDTEEMKTLIRAVTEVTVLQKDMAKDTTDNSAKIEKLQLEVSAQQSSFTSFKWIIGIIAPVISGLLVAILIAGLGL